MEGTLFETSVTAPAPVALNPFSPIPTQTTANTGSPWGKPQQPSPCSLEDVMSEQLATELQEEEEHQTHTEAGVAVEPELLDLIAASSLEGDTSNDLALARMLQTEYDKEYNQLLQKKESKFNGSNKVSVSYENYKSDQSACPDDDDGDEAYDDDYEEKTAWDEGSPEFNRRGISGQGKQITTKHDAVICGRRNASRLMEFPPEFEAGDGEGMDMKLTNSVYNKLKRHSESEAKRGQRLHEKKEHSTATHAMDPRTRLLVYKMVNSHILESVSGAISTGKESVVFHALGGQLGEEPLAHEVAIKVFKTTLNEFKTREKYVHGDHRFSKDDYKKQNPRKIIKMWAMKETANLNRMKKFNIPCPRVQLLRKHILVMSFIGKDQVPAPKLKDARLSSADYEDAYDQVVKIMKTLQRECALVHADLSEYNMLWFDDKVWIIDVSQAVDNTHPRAMEFLYRDCCNVSSFFLKNGVHKVLSPERLFNKITKLNIQGTAADFVAQVQRCDKEQRKELVAMKEYKQYPFDYFFDKALKERQTLLDKVVAMSDSEEEEGVGED